MGYQLWTSPVTGYRRKGTKFTSLKNIFVDNVTAKTIFEPLLCCPSDSLAEHAKDALKVREFDIAGVKETKAGEVIGYVVADDLKHGKINNYINEIGSELLISDSTPIANIFMILIKREFTFVLYGKHIIGIITKADINKPPVRIYLFGMISLFEMHLNTWINHFFPKNIWEKEISDKRLNNARDVYEKRKGNNQDLSLIECIQLCDKRDILKNNEHFINELDLSKNNFGTLTRQVEKIRNELAHSQNSIISNINWPIFVEIVNQLETFLVNSDNKVECIALKGNDFEDLLVPAHN